LLGALIALAFSAGLVWWLAAPNAPGHGSGVVVQTTPRPQPKASATADAAQVQRAFEAVQDAYADSGAEGLARANADCEAALKGDPRVLDYCLAFALYAGAVAPELTGPDADATRLAVARVALPPGVDPVARLGAVRALMRTASLGGATGPDRLAAAEPPATVRSRLDRAAPTVPLARAEPARRAIDNERREEARVAVQALFARAEEARDAARDAAVTGQADAEAPH
jgi:hypothetical protein